MKAVKGFTLIEVMITVVIVAILAAIAYPSYRQYIIRSDRAAAQSVMMDIANREQQFLMANRAYASKATVTASGFSLDSGLASKYDWDITVGTDDVPAFTITFTPKGSQASDVTLTLNHQGVKTPADKW
ncbi:type IV pilin protein [Halopseudomonas aestusnigri]|uniref:type IV pilin protein n=1 Tax=Halopseudomonas aestusnigri TaxID=857252 RepID=UPI002553700D|nr:type IV pilin protein [Halopseudomonas aestusnigri]MDL2198430.1 type IV pilin protein [Halopseudomonas aestusnigri]